MKKFIIILMCSMGLSFAAYSLTCKPDYSGTTSCIGNDDTAGDCTTLGYSTADISGCKHYLYCPFNNEYKRCVATDEIDCVQLGFTTDDKSEWCGEYAYCPYDDNYTLCKGKCTDVCENVYGNVGRYANYGYSTCTACGDSFNIMTHAVCNSGYVRISAEKFRRIIKFDPCTKSTNAYNSIDDTYCVKDGSAYWDDFNLVDRISVSLATYGYYYEGRDLSVVWSAGECPSEYSDTIYSTYSAEMARPKYITSADNEEYVYSGK